MKYAVMYIVMAALAGTSVPTPVGPQSPVGPSAPRFVGRQRRGAVGVRSQTAVLDCLVAGAGAYTVSWVRSRDLQILSHGDTVFTADQRVSLQVTTQPGDVMNTDDDVARHRLTITKLRDSDAGRYECQVNTEPKMSLFFHLTVLDESVAEAAAEWAAERRAPPPPPSLQSSTEPMQRDQTPASSDATRHCVTSLVTSLLLLTTTLRLLNT